MYRRFQSQRAESRNSLEFRIYAVLLLLTGRVYALSPRFIRLNLLTSSPVNADKTRVLPGTTIFLVVLALFFGLFLAYPVSLLLKGAFIDAGRFTFRGGTTLLIQRNGEVRYSISKPLTGPHGDARRERQREYLRRMAAGFALAPYVAFDAKRDASFRGIHRGY